MTDHLYRLPFLICCDTCGLEFFGKSGEARARQHAHQTYHQVRINALVREVLNAVGEDSVPSYAPPLERSTEAQKLSRAAALARLEGIYGVQP